MPDTPVKVVPTEFKPYKVRVKDITPEMVRMAPPPTAAIQHALTDLETSQRRLAELKAMVTAMDERFKAEVQKVEEEGKKLDTQKEVQKLLDRLHDLMVQANQRVVDLGETIVALREGTKEKPIRPDDKWKVEKLLEHFGEDAVKYLEKAVQGATRTENVPIKEIITFPKKESSIRATAGLLDILEGIISNLTKFTDAVTKVDQGLGQVVPVAASQKVAEKNIVQEFVYEVLESGATYVADGGYEDILLLKGTPDGEKLLAELQGLRTSHRDTLKIVKELADKFGYDSSHLEASQKKEAGNATSAAAKLKDWLVGVSLDKDSAKEAEEALGWLDVIVKALPKDASQKKAADDSWTVLPSGENISTVNPTENMYWQDHREGMFMFVKVGTRLRCIAGSGTEPYGQIGEKVALVHDQNPGQRLDAPSKYSPPSAEIVFHIVGTEWESNPQAVVDKIGKVSIPYYVFK